MKTFIVNDKTLGKHVVRAICTEFPKVSVSHVQKALKKQRHPDQRETGEDR